jgi:hypothetical protein
MIMQGGDMVANKQVAIHLEGEIGRDEMNLAEFPITLLTTRAAADQGPIVIEGPDGTLTIRGVQGNKSTKSRKGKAKTSNVVLEKNLGVGLPTASDADVLIGLIQLTKRTNNFTEPTVNFSKYELLKILRWPDDTRYYRRLVDSLFRWKSVTLVYHKCWYDNNIKCKVDATFSILDTVVLYDKATHSSLRNGGQADLPLSSFTWSDTFFKSCRANNLKRLDLDVYFSLKSSITKQLYRYLDKCLYDRKDSSRDRIVINLKDLAFSHVGLSTSYSPVRIKEKLAKPIAELEACQFIKPTSQEERYRKIGHGEWEVTFAKFDSVTTALEVQTSESNDGDDIVSQLTARGITASTARKLTSSCAKDLILKQIEAFDFLMSKKSKAIKTPPAYLRSSIEEDYALPIGFRSKAQIALEAENKRQAQLRQVEAAKTKREQEEREAAEDRQCIEKINAHLASLSPEDRTQLEKSALIEGGFGGFFRDQLIQTHVGRLLGLYPKV